MSEAWPSGPGRGIWSLFRRKGALTHHPKSWRILGGSIPAGRALISALRAACGGCAPKRTCGCSDEADAVSAATSGEGSKIPHRTSWESSRKTCFPMRPAKTCPRQLLCRDRGDAPIFSFAKEKQKPESENVPWLSIICRQRSSAGAAAARRWRPQPT